MKRLIGLSVIVFFPVVFIVAFFTTIFLAFPLVFIGDTIKSFGRTTKYLGEVIIEQLTQAREFYEKAWTLVK